MEHAKLKQPDKTRHFISPDGQTFFEFLRSPDQKEIGLWTHMYLSPEGLQRWERVQTTREALVASEALIVTL